MTSYQCAQHYVKFLKNLLPFGDNLSLAKLAGVTDVLRDIISRFPVRMPPLPQQPSRCDMSCVSLQGDGMLLWRVNSVLKSLEEEPIPSCFELLPSSKATEAEQL